YWLGRERIARLFDDRAPIYLHPTVQPIGDTALLLWPSTRSDPGSRQALVERTPRLIDELRNFGATLVAGHEQIFRGPIPATYRRRLDAAHLRATTIPHYAPSPSRDCLLGLARSLASEADLALASGHIHDPVEVLGAGAPYL